MLEHPHEPVAFHDGEKPDAHAHDADADSLVETPTTLVTDVEDVEDVEDVPGSCQPQPLPPRSRTTAVSVTRIVGTPSEDATDTRNRTYSIVGAAGKASPP